MPVTPAAADRSSGSTTAIVYDWRVGTSIWLMLNRMSSTSVARASFGMNGTRISSTLDGRWVNTIVRMSPNRAASGPAASAEKAARMLAANRMPPTIAGSASNWLEPEGDEPSMTKPPPKASSANRAARRATMPRDLWRPSLVATGRP